MRPFRLAVQTFITWKNDLEFDGIDVIPRHCSDGMPPRRNGSCLPQP